MLIFRSDIAVRFTGDDAEQLVYRDMLYLLLDAFHHLHNPNEIIPLLFTIFEYNENAYPETQQLYYLEAVFDSHIT